MISISSVRFAVTRKKPCQLFGIFVYGRTLVRIPLLLAALASFTDVSCRTSNTTSILVAKLSIVSRLDTNLVAYWDIVRQVPGAQHHTSIQNQDISTGVFIRTLNVRQQTRNVVQIFHIKNVTPFLVRDGGHSLDSFAKMSSFIFLPAWTEIIICRYCVLSCFRTMASVFCIDGL